MRIGIGYRAGPGGEGDSPFPLIYLALRDALLGAAGLGPSSGPDPRADPVAPTEGVGEPERPQEKGAPDRLAAAVHRVERENYQVVNVDIALRTGTAGAAFDPEAARGRLARALHVGPDAVALRPSDAAGVPGGGGDGGPAALVAVLIDQVGDTDALLAALRSAG